jgi:hypothetical protein
MSLNKNNDGSSRIVNLDFLRGFFIILAMDQHFTYYINMWYVEYFRDASALTSTYKVHFPMIGHQVATDQANLLLDWIFTPWVSQVYLTLAAFNLAKYAQSFLRDTLASKLKVYFLIFLFFVMENFIVAPNMGQAISVYPIMLWMVVLSIISIAFSLIGIWGVIILTVLSLFRWLLPIDMISDLFENFIKYNIHPGFEYDARIEYFFTSGCLGFLMGYVHYHKPALKKFKDYYFALTGLVFVAFWVAYGDPYLQEAGNVFRHEHDLARTFSGTLYILGIQAILISAFLWLERNSVKLNIPVVNWVGKHSIFIFAFHRIFFVRILAPISVLIGSITGRTLGASIWEMYTYVAITIVVCYFIKRTRMGELILQIKG